MAAYIITYDLHKQGQNYSCLSEKLKQYTKHWHIQGSVWIVETSESASTIRDKLKRCLDGNDKLVVALLQGEAAWVGYNGNVTAWLKGVLA